MCVQYMSSVYRDDAIEWMRLRWDRIYENCFDWPQHGDWPQNQDSRSLFVFKIIFTIPFISIKKPFSCLPRHLKNVFKMNVCMSTRHFENVHGRSSSCNPYNSSRTKIVIAALKNRQLGWQSVTNDEVKYRMRGI